MRVSSLSITASGGQPLANSFLQGEPPGRCLAVMLPGIRYTADMPLLYYTTQVLQYHGVDVLQLHPDYDTPAFQKAPVKERLSRMTHDTRAGLEAGLAAGSYRQVVLAGKSIGTLSMALLLDASTGLE